jgi:hypothetical protein
MFFPIRCFTLVLLFLVLPTLASADFHNSISLQGFTGLLNTPNAATTDEGKIYLSYSNQEEPQWRNRTSHQDNYLVSLGFFNLLELGVRLVEAPKVTRDLSGSFKLRIPFLPKGEYLPQLAVGLQDLGGGSRHLQTGYAVASEELWRFRLSVGYGTGPDRMKGVFGGAEFKACDWLYLLAENDTRESNVGLRLVTPSLFGYPVNLQGTVKSSLDHEPGHPEFAVGLQFPLGLDHDDARAIALPSPPPTGEPAGSVASMVPQATAAATPDPQGAPGEEAPPAAVSQALKGLLKRLTGDGFENVRVGAAGKVLVVEYENARYNHNELDAIGVVAGLTQNEAPSWFETLRLVEKKKDIRVLQIEMPLRALRAFFADAAHVGALRSSLRISDEITDDGKTVFVTGDHNSSALKASLMLYPGLVTYVGTEVGTFDYLLSLKPDLYLNLWKGAVFDVRADIPVSWSSNFEDGKRFRGDRHDPRMDRLMIFQAVKPVPSVMAVIGGGMVLAQSYGTANELVWTPGEGNHQVKLSQVYGTGGGTNGTNGTHGVDEEYLGSYRYYFAPLDLYLQGTGGKFLTRDTGFVGEFRRFFGDTSVTIFYKNSSTQEGKNLQVGGIQFDLPLTPRRDMKPYLLQVRGSDDWSYAQETVIAKEGRANAVGASVGVRLEPPFNVDRVFYNRDRLSDDYIKKHLLRLRDAYRRYALPATESSAAGSAPSIAVPQESSQR